VKLAALAVIGYWLLVGSEKPKTENQKPKTGAEPKAAKPGTERP